MALVQRTRNGMALYAIMFTDSGVSEVRIEYVHAENGPHARAQFWAGKPRGRGVTIIEAGPVVGFFENEQGITV